MNKTISALSLIGLLCVSLTGFAGELAPSLPSNRQEVQTALQALRPQSPSQVRVGEFAAVDTTETLQGTSPVVRLQEATTILEKYENNNSFQFRIVYDRAEYRNGQVFYRSEQGQVVFQKGEPTIFENIAFGEYSNLKSEVVMINVPEKVLKRKNCGGLDGCPEQVPGRKVSFEFRDRNGRTWQYEVWGSPAVPFLATPMKLCATTAAPYGDHELNVTTCKEMKDFSAGR